jgi:hypothetical protein
MPVTYVHKNAGAAKQLETRVNNLTRLAVKIGVLQDTTKRKAEPQTNALLAYVHENGSPVKGIPARPFLRPALLSNADYIREKGAEGIEREILGEKNAARRCLAEVGMRVMLTAKSNITNQVGFKPLAANTLRARQKKGFDGTSALVHTGQLVNSIHYKVDSNA